MQVCNTSYSGIWDSKIVISRPDQAKLVTPYVKNNIPKQKGLGIDQEVEHWAWSWAQFLILRKKKKKKIKKKKRKNSN
jgi:hypothetical protein